MHGAPSSGALARRTVSSYIRGDDPVPGEQLQSVDSDKEEDGFRKTGLWQRRGHWRLVKAPSLLALASGAGLFIWFACVFSLDEFVTPTVQDMPLAYSTGNLRGSLARPDLEAGTELHLGVEELTKALSLSGDVNIRDLVGKHLGGGLVDGNATRGNMTWEDAAKLMVDFLRPALNSLSNSSTAHSVDKGQTHAAVHAEQGAWPRLWGSNFTAKATWLTDRLHSADTRHWNATKQLTHIISRIVVPRVNGSADVLLQQIREKQVEIKQKGEEVQVASEALYEAIRSGEVHQGVVVGAVAAFLICATALQMLGAMRTQLRQAIRTFLARSLLVRQPAPNELVTRPYATWAELVVRSGLDFLNEPANVMLLSIGSLQVLATWSKSDPWRCKKINLLVLLLNWAYTIVQEVRAQWLAAQHDAQWNSISCLRAIDGDVGGLHGKSEEILAMSLTCSDVVLLRYGDICPAVGVMIQSSHSYVLFNTLCETGEDCCSILSVGDTVLLGFVVAIEGAEVLVQVTETRNGASQPRKGEVNGAGGEILHTKSRRMERFPEHMNQPLTQANIVALALLFVASVLVCALNYQSSAAETTMSPGAGSHKGTQLSRTEHLLILHFFSAAVQLNTVIPSMRWVVIFFFYIFLVEAARPDVSVQNWRAFQGLRRRRIMYSDKTGTLTEVGMAVARLRSVGTGADLVPNGASDAEEDLAWLAAVLMACNDSKARPKPEAAPSSPIAGRRPGTSPEEIAIAEHLEAVLQVVVDSNPIRPANPPASAKGSTISSHTQPLILRHAVTGHELIRASVLSRSDFNPAMGCREARLEFPADSNPGSSSLAGSSWIVRQGGADVVADFAGTASAEVELASVDRGRALGWCVARLAVDGARVGAWRYILRASFVNPPRQTSAPMVKFCHSAGISVRMLTGDASVAAIHIAREIGILDRGDTSPTSSNDFCEYEPGETAEQFAGRLKQKLASPSGRLGVAVPGSVLKQQIEANTGADEWLADDRVSAVIYRTRAADKAVIVKRTEELGRRQQQVKAAVAARQMRPCMPRKPEGDGGACIMIGDAANDAQAIGLEGVVGISMRHGAAPCKLGADFIVDVPGGFIALHTELQGRALAGAKWLLEDVCLLCGLVSSLTLCGVWANSFTFLPRGFLYDDPFDARLMMFFSSGLYAPSSCMAACSLGSALGIAGSMASHRDVSSATPAARRTLLIGAAIGSTLGMIGPIHDPKRFGRWILSATTATCVIRHLIVSSACALPPTDDASAANGFAAAVSASSEAPSCIARVLDRGSKPWVRGILLTLYLMLAWA